jgi:hypothetical protein
VRIIIPPYMGKAISHTKNSSLASVITVPELMLTAQMIYTSTYRAIESSRHRRHLPGTDELSERAADVFRAGDVRAARPGRGPPPAAAPGRAAADAAGVISA